jgi:tetratricopeptide (TPR) repeat protein
MRRSLVLVLFLASCADAPPPAPAPPPREEDPVEKLILSARAHREAGRRLDAEKDLDEARLLAEGAADGYYNDGVRALAQRRTADADRYFGYALELDPQHSKAHLAMARAYMERRRYRDAVREYDRVIVAHPQDADLYYHRGNARLLAGLGEEAYADFSIATDLAPQDATYLAARAVGRHRVRRDLEAARADFDRAIELDGVCYHAWYGRGLLRQEMKDLEGAEKDLRRALSLRASPEGTIALGRILQERGQYDLATSIYENAITVYPDPEAQRILRAELARLLKEKP